MSLSDDFQQLVLDGELALRDTSKDIKSGIESLERALLIGSDDQKILSAIFCQLGNAYFSLHDFKQAKNFYMNDLTISRQLKSEIKEAEAYSNLSVSYTMLLDFKNAVFCAERVISIGARLNDEILKSRGYYNRGLAYLHSVSTWSDEDDHVDDYDHSYIEFLRERLQNSISSFKEYLSIMEKQKDKLFCGLGLGNLGNAYFCSSDYKSSIECNEKRLVIARELGDRSSIRRALINIARAHSMLGNHDHAWNSLLAAQRNSRESDCPEEVRTLIESELENLEKILEEKRTNDDSFSLSSKQTPSSRASSSRTRKSILKRYCKSVTNLDSLGSKKLKKRLLQNKFFTSGKVSTELAVKDEENEGEFMMGLIEKCSRQIDDQRTGPERINKIPLNFDDQQSLNSDLANSSSGNSRRLSLPRLKLASMTGTLRSVTNLKPTFFSGKNQKRFSKINKEASSTTNSAVKNVKKDDKSDDVSSSKGSSLTSKIIKMEVKDD